MGGRRRELSNISKIDAPGTALGEEILKLKSYSIKNGVAKLFLVSEPESLLGRLNTTFHLVRNSNMRESTGEVHLENWALILKNARFL